MTAETDRPHRSIRIPVAVLDWLAFGVLAGLLIIAGTARLCFRIRDSLRARLRLTRRRLGKRLRDPRHWWNHDKLTILPYTCPDCHRVWAYLSRDGTTVGATCQRCSADLIGD